MDYTKTNEMSDELSGYRSEIDSIDEQLIKLFARRMEVTTNVGKYKLAKGMQVLDRSREREVLSKRSAGLPSPLDSNVRRLMSTIMEMSRAGQSILMAKDAPLVCEVNTAIEGSPRKLPKSATVACQGIEGSYSSIAADKLFTGAEIVFMDSFEGVARAVRSGLCDFGVLPIENNVHGSVGAVYDIMRDLRFSIVQSFRMRIDHCLAVKEGVKESEITTILSHEQALGQCGEFLKGLKDVEVKVCENTAVAARMAAESDQRGVAAICSSDCGKIYGLDLIRRDIQNSDNNFTRFVVIARDLLVFEGADKASIMFSVAHKPGSLYEVISRFASAGLNITKLESRPIPGRDFEFRFHLDVDADCRDQNTLALIASLEECTEEFVFLGAYPERGA